MVRKGIITTLYYWIIHINIKLLLQINCLSGLSFLLSLSNFCSFQLQFPLLLARGANRQYLRGRAKFKKNRSDNMKINSSSARDFFRTTWRVLASPGGLLSRFSSQLSLFKIIVCAVLDKVSGYLLRKSWLVESGIGGGGRKRGEGRDENHLVAPMLLAGLTSQKVYHRGNPPPLEHNK